MCGIILDLSVPELSYIFGLLQADGNLYNDTRNRGRVTLELSIRDEDIVQKIKSILPVKSSVLYRTRNTNFKNNMSSCRLNIYDFNFRKELISCGFKVTSKDASIPICKYKDIDFWRGFLDGDGSVGFTSTGRPFISLTTNSENIKKYFLMFLDKEFNIQKCVNRNKRDGIYNLFISGKKVHKICNVLYYQDCLSIDRKYKIASLIGSSDSSMIKKAIKPTAKVLYSIKPLINIKDKD